MLREPNRKDAHKAHLPGPLTQLVQSATLTKWKSQVQVLQGPQQKYMVVCLQSLISSNSAR